MAVTGPEICARCLYDLRGLPVPHRCPECGLEYDEHTRIWRPERSWNFVVVSVVLNMGLFGGCLTAAMRFLSAPSLQRGSFLLLMASAAVVFVAYLVRTANHRQSRVAAVTPAGIFIHWANQSLELPWANFVNATPQRFGALHVKEVGHLTAHEFNALFDSREELEAFCVACEHARARYTRGEANG